MSVNQAIVSSAFSKNLYGFSFENVSCSRLSEIDKLWQRYSIVNGKEIFGLQVQRQIHQEMDYLPQDTSGDIIEYLIFALQVGWIKIDLGFEDITSTTISIEPGAVLFRGEENTRFSSESISIFGENWGVSVPTDTVFKQYGDLGWDINSNLLDVHVGHLPASPLGYGEVTITSSKSPEDYITQYSIDISMAAETETDDFRLSVALAGGIGSGWSNPDTSSGSTSLHRGGLSLLLRLEECDL